MRTAVVAGSGPNGLAAAIALAREDVAVTVYEAKETPGGGCRTQELTLPGYRHDVCSAIHPLGAGSPFFRTLPLTEYGLEWIQPDFALAHPFDDGSAAVLCRSLDETANGLGRDGDAYRRLMQPFVENWDDFSAAVLGPVLRVPRSPLLLARFGVHARRSATGLATSAFEGEQARALFTGIAAHANVPLTGAFTAGFAMVLGSAAHAVGWPIPKGGSQAVTDALLGYLRQVGGRVEANHRVESLAGLEDADVVLFDLTPRQVLTIAGEHLSEGYRRKLRGFRYGAGVFKVDYALNGPVPWTATECLRAGTVHLGSSMAEIVASEDAVAEGRCPERPYVLVAQQSLFDPTRAPEGKRTLWAYCHVPAGSTVDMTGRLEAQIERFAPGFRDLVLARHTTSPAALEAYNENYVGGDIAGGSHEGLQLLLRPAPSLSPYRTSDPRLLICSASTPPGAGVHGMCGYYAALAALSTISHRQVNER